MLTKLLCHVTRKTLPIEEDQATTIAIELHKSQTSSKEYHTLIKGLEAAAPQITKKKRKPTKSDESSKKLPAKEQIMEELPEETSPVRQEELVPTLKY